MANTNTRPAASLTVGYHLGSIGTWLRLLLGVLLPLGFLGVEFTDEGFTSSNMVEVAQPPVVIFAVYFTAHWLLGERFFARVNPWVSTLILYGPVFVVPYLDFLPLTFRSVSACTSPYHCWWRSSSDTEAVRWWASPP